MLISLRKILESVALLCLSQQHVSVLWSLTVASGYAKRFFTTELNENSVPVSHLNVQSNTLNGESGFIYETVLVVWRMTAVQIAWLFVFFETGIFCYISSVLEMVRFAQELFKFSQCPYLVETWKTRPWRTNVYVCTIIG